MKNTEKQQCEYLRQQAKAKFDKVRGTWVDLLRWAMPHRGTWLNSQNQGERKNHHIVDPTHILALRSCVAGFSEGNTSTTRPWYRIDTKDSDRNDKEDNKKWLQHFTQRTLAALASSNFYDSAGTFYYDYHVVNTGGLYFEDLEDGGFFVHSLMPGSYFVIDNSFKVAVVLIREFSLNVKSIVDTYGKFLPDGERDWSNISNSVKKMYLEGSYGEMVDVVQVIQQNANYDKKNPRRPDNKQWLELTYECGNGTRNGNTYADGNGYGEILNDKNESVFLKRHTTKRKNFIVGKSSKDFEYGEKGPTLDALGTIKSLNKKAIGKDQALEQILAPALQGPAAMRKSYVSSAPNTFVPIDSRSMGAKQKLEPIFQINPAIGAIVQDVQDMRNHVDKLYYADFLLYLSKNPKTRTAAETNAIVEEQQRIVGPSLQSLNDTFNVPVVEWVMDYVLENDPYLDPPPEDLAGQLLKPDFVSVFAQAQKAADLPAVDRFVQMVTAVGQIDPRILEKLDTDVLADIYEDRLYLPSGLNRSQQKVDEKREQQQKQMQQQQMLQETLPAVAGAAKDLSSAKQQPQ